MNDSNLHDSRFFVCRLYVQENSLKTNSSHDDLGLLDDDDPQLFRRTGIIAAFDSLERAKK